MQEQYYNLPMVRENFFSRNLKKLFQGFFNIKRKKRDQKRASILAQRAKLNKNSTDTVAVSGVHQRVDIYEFQSMYRRGEISIENMNEEKTVFGEETNQLCHPPLYYQIMRLCRGVEVQGDVLVIHYLRLRIFSFLIALGGLGIFLYLGFSVRDLFLTCKSQNIL